MLRLGCANDAQLKVTESQSANERSTCRRFIFFPVAFVCWQPIPSHIEGTHKKLRAAATPSVSRQCCRPTQHAAFADLTLSRTEVAKQGLKDSHHPMHLPTE